MFLRYKKAWVLPACFAALAIFLAWGAQGNTEKLTWKNRVQQEYDRAYYELLDGMNNINTDLEKLRVATSTEEYATLLARLSTQSQRAADQMDRLSGSGKELADTTKFLQQIGGLSTGLLQKLAAGELPRETAKAQIEQAAEICQSLQVCLQKAEIPGASELEQTENWIAPEEEPLAYPHLIYDGPFSDGHEDGESRGLESLPLFEKEATEQAAEDCLGENLQYLGSQEDAMPCDLYADALGNTAAITRQGGKLRWLLKDRELNPGQLDEEQCRGIAEKAAEDYGFADMTVTWVQMDANSATVSLAAVQEDVWLYPDMIKIKLARDDGSVLALDASEYWAHHQNRSLGQVSITKEEAENALISGMETKETQLVMANLNDEEVLLWQVEAWLDDSRFYIMIDAQTGEQRQIFRVVQTEMGSLVM